MSAAKRPASSRSRRRRPTRSDCGTRRFKSETAVRTGCINQSERRAIRHGGNVLHGEKMSKNKNLAGGLFQSKPTPLTQTETSLSSQIAEYLTTRGIYNERLNSSGRVETKSGYWITLCAARNARPSRYRARAGDFHRGEIGGQKADRRTVEKARRAARGGRGFNRRRFLPAVCRALRRRPRRRSLLPPPVRLNGSAKEKARPFYGQALPYYKAANRSGRFTWLAEKSDSTLAETQAK